MPDLYDRIDQSRFAIGAALLDIQNLGKKHREAVARLEAAYVELADLTDDSRMRSNGVEDVA